MDFSDGYYHLFVEPCSILRETLPGGHGRFCPEPFALSPVLPSAGGVTGLLRGGHELGVRRHVALVQEPASFLLLAVAQAVLVE